MYNSGNDKQKVKSGRLGLVKSKKPLPYAKKILREDTGSAKEIGDALPVLYAGEKSLPSQILDLGCGNTVRDFEGKDKEKINIERCDIWDTAVDNLTVSDLNKKFPYASNTFDWVIAIEILEHLENPWHFFRECKRVARSSSPIFLSVPFIESPRQRVLFYDTGSFQFFGSVDKLKYRDGFKHITPIFEWQLAQIFLHLGMIVEYRSLVETSFDNFEILLLKIRIVK